MKRCSLCRSEKPFDDFNRDRSRSDGRQNLCRTCQKGNYKRGTNAERHNERVRQYWLDNPERKKAWRKLDYAITSGKMVRGFCECCGNEKADAHHWKGYDRPLDVQWLCRSCHVTLEPRRGVAA